MDSWKTLIVFFFQKPKFVSFLLFNSAVGIHNHRIRARRIRRPWRTFVLLPRTKPSGHWEVAIWFRLGCSTKLFFFFKNLERVKMHSIIKKPTISLWLEILLWSWIYSKILPSTLGNFSKKLLRVSGTPLENYLPNTKLLEQILTLREGHFDHFHVQKSLFWSLLFFS